MVTTNNHGYEKPANGSLDWDVPVNANYDLLDVDIPVRDTDANKGNYTASSGAMFIATDTGVVYTGNGSSWVDTDLRFVDVGGLSNGDHIYWNGSALVGEQPPAGGSGGSGGLSYNERVELANFDTVEIPVAVPNGQTLTVVGWGVIEADRTATPAGLFVELWNDSDSQVAAESTSFTANPSGASITNSSGSTKWYKLAVTNGTGNDYIIGESPDSVFVHFEWTVE